MTGDKMSSNEQQYLEKILRDPILAYLLDRINELETRILDIIKN